MQRGKCELCHRLRDLHDSHFLPKGGYKRARESTLSNPNPVVLAAGKAKQSSEQIRGFKFCTDCEDRLNKGGESWVVNAAPQTYGASFSVHDALRKTEPFYAGPGLQLYRASDVPEIDLEKLLYFGISMFWRGTLKWRAVAGGEIPRLSMSCRHKEALRQFLLNRKILPSDLAITVAIWPFRNVHPVVIPPTLDTSTKHKRFRFCYSGFIFLLSVGKGIPLSEREVDAHWKKVIVLSAAIGQSTLDDIKRNIKSVDISSIQKMLDEIVAMRAATSSNA